MAKTFTRKNYGTWDVWHKSYTTDQLSARRAQLAKVANTRILRLERAKSDITAKPLIEQQQFNIVSEYLTSHNQRRFSESKTKKFSDSDLRREITVLENFLAMKTSTVGGLRRAEESTINTFVDKYNVPREIATSPQFYEFLNSETFHDIVENTMASESIFEIMEAAYDEGMDVDSILDNFEKWKDKDEGQVWKAFGFKPLSRRR